MNRFDIASVPAVVLAGGLATRLGTIARATPKALTPIAGRPFIDHQLALLHRNGLRKIVLCLGHLGELVQGHLTDGSRWGMELRYSFDGPDLVGTGGAIRLAAPMLGEDDDDPFWVMYGDSYMEIDYRAVLDAFLSSGAEGMMTVLRNDDRWDRSNVVFRDGKLLRYDKARPTPDMNYIDFGVALLRRRALRQMPAAGAFDLADLYRQLAEERALASFEVHSRFYEIGTPAALEETRQYLESRLSFTSTFLDESARIIAALDRAAIDRVADQLVLCRERGGRLFFLGVGGSAANASHAVNDFRKIAGFEAYAPTDNVSELTARVNDESWADLFVNWLKGSRLAPRDLVFVLSVGGGNLEKNVSPNLVKAVQYAKEVGTAVCGIVGRDGGYTATRADACVIVPTVNPDNVTPHAESFQAVIWHLLVSHPALKRTQTKWESVR